TVNWIRGRTMALLAGMLIADAGALSAQSTDQLHTDWADLARYRDANAQLGPPRPGEQRVVFMGNSITDAWAQYFDSTFPGKPYVGRGISGQTTPQMLVRFRQDVIALKPRVVVISSVLPVFEYPWARGLEPAPKIVALNAWIRNYATAHGAIYLDYYRAVADERGGMRSDLSTDGVHPNEAGYRVMAPLAEQAIERALKRRR